jgi:hypothetical protein
MPLHPTHFTVDRHGTLELAGVGRPSSRAEAYDLPLKSLPDLEAVTVAAEGCRPLGRWLHYRYAVFREDYPARSEGLPANPAQGIDRWIGLLSSDEANALLAAAHAWVRAQPDWAQEEDDIPRSATGQGAALEFFEDWDAEDLAALGIEIVEGDHPGSTYYAAELRHTPEAANQAALERALPVRFTGPEAA